MQHTGEQLEPNTKEGGSNMPYIKRGKYYYRKGKRYSLKQIRAIHFSKLRRKSGKPRKAIKRKIRR